MLTNMPVLSHQEQQEAVERIQELMMNGMSSGEAIAIVAQELRESNPNRESVTAIFDDE